MTDWEHCPHAPRKTLRLAKCNQPLVYADDSGPDPWLWHQPLGRMISCKPRGSDPQHICLAPLTHSFYKHFALERRMNAVRSFWHDLALWWLQIFFKKQVFVQFFQWLQSAGLPPHKNPYRSYQGTTDLHCPTAVHSESSDQSHFLPFMWDQKGINASKESPVLSEEISLSGHLWTLWPLHPSNELGHSPIISPRPLFPSFILHQSGF